jgi:hypothetical protein
MGCRSNENEINNAATELAHIIISAARPLILGSHGYFEKIFPIISEIFS